MSAETVKSSSNPSDQTPRSTEPMDDSDYVYNIPSNERISVCYFLDQYELWEAAARKMGYSEMDIIVSLLHSWLFLSI